MAKSTRLIFLECPSCSVAYNYIRFSSLLPCQAMIVARAEGFWLSVPYSHPLLLLGGPVPAPQLAPASRNHVSSLGWAVQTPCCPWSGCFISHQSRAIRTLSSHQPSAKSLVGSWQQWLLPFAGSLAERGVPTKTTVADHVALSRSSGPRDCPDSCFPSLSFCTVSLPVLGTTHHPGSTDSPASGRRK